MAASPIAVRVSSNRLSMVQDGGTAIASGLGGGGVGAGVAAGAAIPEITALRNPTYFTGLDTDAVSERSHVSQTNLYAYPRASGEEPPPPYRPRSVALPAAVARQGSRETLPGDGERRVSMLMVMNPSASTGSFDTSPFADPEGEEVDGAIAGVSDGMRYGEGAQPASRRTPSNRSFTSTLYSSNASVRSARPARLSIASAHVLDRPSVEDPFRDPEGGLGMGGSEKSGFGLRPYEGT